MTPPTVPTSTATAATRGAPDPRLRVAYWIMIVVATIDLSLILARSTRYAPSHQPYPWLIPAGLLCFGVGGLLGPRHPAVHRVLIGVSIALALAAIVFMLRS